MRISIVNSQCENEELIPKIGISLGKNREIPRAEAFIHAVNMIKDEPRDYALGG